jgi:hypothetical protein
MINEQNALKYCKDDISKIENYEKAIADPKETWDLHHRLELTLDGEFAHTAEDLKRMDMYHHRPYFELIFLTHAEHCRLHGACMSDETKQKMSDAAKGKHHSEETRRQIAEAHKGKHHTAETKCKLSDANKGRKLRPFTAEHRRKMSEAHKGKEPWNKGKHHSYEYRKKMSAAQKGKRKGMHWKLIDGKRVWY